MGGVGRVGGRGRRVQVPLGGVEVQRRGEPFHRLVDLLGRHEVILGIHHGGVVQHGDVVRVTNFRTVKIGVELFHHFERCVVSVSGTHARGEFHPTTRGRSYVTSGQINGAILCLIVATERRRQSGVPFGIHDVIILIKVINMSGDVMAQRGAAPW